MSDIIFSWGKLAIQRIWLSCRFHQWYNHWEASNVSVKITSNILEQTSRPNPTRKTTSIQLSSASQRFHSFFQTVILSGEQVFKHRRYLEYKPHHQLIVSNLPLHLHRLIARTGASTLCEAWHSSPGNLVYKLTILRAYLGWRTNFSLLLW